MTATHAYPDLLKDLQKLHKKLVDGYVQAVRTDVALESRLRRRHQASEIGGSFDAFANLCAHRTAVQVLLRTVYVRVLEDLGALEKPRIDGDAGLWDFQQFAPALGIRAFFDFIFRDMATVLPALFVPGPDELGLPSETLCQAIWDLWHAQENGRVKHHFGRDADGRFDSRFLGDLYQDLDADIRKRFALLQTPRFVESFILDRTLTPALVEFDPATLRARGETFRIVDPTCGSGHFLIGAFHRLADYWQGQGCEPWEACERALESVWGCDINPHAVDIADFRLLLEVMARTGETKLEQLGHLDLHLAVLDSLIPWERGKFAKAQGSLLELDNRLNSYATPEERKANADFLTNAFHVVVGNPPYITPKDAKKRDDYRAFWPNSAAGKYALSAPFVERLFALCAPGGFMGQITSNSFMKREFGKHVVRNVLPAWDLTGVVDTSGAYIPGHGTPTVILFGRGRSPVEKTIWTVLGKRGEPKRPALAENGVVWSAVVAAKAEPDDSNLFVSSAEINRGILAVHPWSLGGGFAGDIMAAIADGAESRAGDWIVDAGPGGIPGQDTLFIYSAAAIRRIGLQRTAVVAIHEGDAIRDYAVTDEDQFVLFTYSEDGETGLALPSPMPPVERLLWRWRGIVLNRPTKGFGRIGNTTGAWTRLSFFYPKRFARQNLTLTEVATHNHFVLARGRQVFKQTAPVLILAAKATQDDQLSLLGLLNSSTLEFWGRQTFMAKGGDQMGDGARSSAEEWSDRLQRDTTKLLRAPLAIRDREARMALARALDRTANERLARVPGSVLARAEPGLLTSSLAVARAEHQSLTEKMVALQEELDWLTYGTYRLIEPVPTVGPDNLEPVTPGHRPFAIHLARLDEEADDDERSTWWSRHGHDRATEIPDRYQGAQRQRMQDRLDAIDADPRLQLLETFAFKRRWQLPDWDKEVRTATERWLLDTLEDLFAPPSDQSKHSEAGKLREPKPVRLEEIAAVWSRDPRVQEVIDVWQGTVGSDLTSAAEKLLRGQALPDHDYRIYSEEGLRRRAQWREVWALQDREDAGETGLDIPVPPAYAKTDFLKPGYYDVRGKLDVPRERFIAFDDCKPVLWGWNGWRDLDRAQAQADAWGLVANDPSDPLPSPSVSDPRRCGPTLGLWQSLDDVRRWDTAAHFAELRDLATHACARASCPCDVLPAWQSAVKASKGGRAGKLSIEAAQPMVAVPTVEERAQAMDIVKNLGTDAHDMFAATDRGGTLEEIAARWPWSRERLPVVLDDLCATGDLHSDGRGGKRKYLVSVQPEIARKPR